MRQFYEINSIHTTAEQFKAEGYKVINFSMAKAEIMTILRDKETAFKFHLFNEITDNDPEMQAICDQLKTIVFKESRGNRLKMAIGWENGNSYLRYHSGIIYKWFN